MNSVEGLLHSGPDELRTFWQPIIKAEDGSVFGYESLLRGPKNSAFEFPDVLFSRAVEEELDAYLDYEALRLSMARFTPPQSDAFLFLNFRPHTFDVLGETFGSADAAIDRLGLPDHLNGRVVFEVLESFEYDLDHIAPLVAKLRARGYLIAIDDMGEGYDRLQLIQLLRPDFVKLSGQLTAKLGADGFSRKVVSAVSDMINDVGAKLIVEGVETDEQMEVVKTLGAFALQGFGLARPNPDYEIKHDACDRLGRFPSPSQPLETIGQIVKTAAVYDIRAPISEDLCHPDHPAMLVVESYGQPLALVPRPPAEVIPALQNYGDWLNAAPDEAIYNLDCVQETVAMVDAMHVRSAIGGSATPADALLVYSGDELVGYCKIADIVWHVRQDLYYMKSREKGSTRNVLTRKELFSELQSRIDRNISFSVALVRAEWPMGPLDSKLETLNKQVGRILVDALPRTSLIGTLGGGLHAIMLDQSGAYSFVEGAVQQIQAHCSVTPARVNLDVETVSRRHLCDTRLYAMMQSSEDNVVPLRRAT